MNQARERWSRETVVLLTTWNRPQLLEQALRDIERECNYWRLPLVISDDRSNNVDTLAILEEAKCRDIEVISPPEPRTAFDDAHIATGRNADFAFNWVLDHYPNVKQIIKVDDDIVLDDRAFGIMLLTWDKAVAYKEAGLIDYDMVTLSGIQTIHEKTIDDFEFAIQGSQPCAACCIYPAEDIRICFSEINKANLCMNGWDWTFWEEYRRRWKPNAKALFLRSSVAYHAGKSGVHVCDQDININYTGNLEGVVVI